jgi:hypothetical protein
MAALSQRDLEGRVPLNSRQSNLFLTTRVATSILFASLALNDVNVLVGANGAGVPYGNSEPCCALQAVQSGDSGLAASAQRQYSITSGITSR